MNPGFAAVGGVGAVAAVALTVAAVGSDLFAPRTIPLAGGAGLQLPVLVEAQPDGGVARFVERAKVVPAKLPAVVLFDATWERDAYRAASEMVRGVLLAPGSAQFGRFEEAEIGLDQAEGPTVGVRSRVDAQNVNGVLVRASFYAVVVLERPGGWRLKQLTITTGPAGASMLLTADH